MKLGRHLIIQKILIGLFLIGLFWWISIHVRHLKYSFENYVWNLPLILIPISGGLYNLIRQKNAHINRNAFIWFSVGLVVWGCGTCVFLIYNIFLNIEIPYPSIADIFYLISYVCFLVGLINIRILHTHKRSRETLRVALGLIVSYILVIILHSILILGENFQFIFSVNIFCLFVYPMFDFLFFVLSARLIYELLYYPDSRKAYAIFLVTSLFLLYIADMGFSLTTQNGQYFVGHWTDGLFLIVFFLMTYAATLYEE